LRYNWAKYNSGDGVVEVIIRDETGAKVEVFTVNQKDTKKQKQISYVLKEKYDVDFTLAEEGLFDF
jgi:hypothetical protein